MTLPPTCLIACVRFLPPPDDITYSEEPRIWDDPPNIDTEPPFDDELDLDFEDEYVCPVHGRIDGGSECPRC